MILNNVIIETKTDYKAGRSYDKTYSLILKIEVPNGELSYKLPISEEFMGSIEQATQLKPIQIKVPDTESDVPF